MLGVGPARIHLTEARAGVGKDGILKARELCKFQEIRFAHASLDLAARLQGELGWSAKGELDGDDELVRIRLGHGRSMNAEGE